MRTGVLDVPKSISPDSLKREADFYLIKLPPLPPQPTYHYFILTGGFNRSISGYPNQRCSSGHGYWTIEASSPKIQGRWEEINKLGDTSAHQIINLFVSFGCGLHSMFGNTIVGNAYHVIVMQFDAAIDNE